MEKLRLTSRGAVDVDKEVEHIKTQVEVRVLCTSCLWLPWLCLNVLG